MLSFLSVITLGFFLGMRHATDPDHVIAVTTIVSREQRVSKSAWIGAFWGIGHTLTILVVGAAIILFNVVIPPRLGLTMELAVGGMLILLGLFNVTSFFRAASPGMLSSDRIHSHAHSHGDYVHTHPHAHEPEQHPHAANQTLLAKLDRAMMKFTAYRPLRPLFIGIVHGLAGSAAAALLVLATIRDPHCAVAYLLVFGVGTIAGMMLITMGIASSFRFASGGRDFSRKLALASGVLSLAFGLFVAYQICVVNGLLTSNPQWTPK